LVSEVEDWILPDLDRYTIEMEMENMLQMMTRQEEAEAKAEACHDKAEADAKVRHEKSEARAVARHKRFLVFLNGLTSYGKGATT
jgi:hypothetical protein